MLWIRALQLLRAFLCLVLLSLYLALPLGARAEREQATLSDQLIRLHVVANSDSPEDQAQKLRVRDAVLTGTQAFLVPGLSRDEAAALLLEHRSELLSAAERESGGRPVEITLSREYYPTRRYQNFALPAGEYLSLRVLVGAAKGHNWWCVVYPPLCTELCTEETAPTLSPEEQELITGGEGTEIRFRLIEWWESLMERLNRQRDQRDGT